MSISWLKEEIPILVSSDPDSGNSNLSMDGSYFEIRLEDEGLKVPRDARNCNISVINASIWNSVPNIVTGVEDKFYITGPDNMGQLTNFIVTIPQGLYSVNNLVEFIEQDLANQGASTELNGKLTNLVDFQTNTATQKIVLVLNYPNVVIDFSPVDSIDNILGFQDEIVSVPSGPLVLVPYYVEAPSVARFNALDYFLINSDLSNAGLRINNKYNNTIARVLVDVEPNSQIVYNPQHLIKTNANHLVGTARTSFALELTDQTGRRVDTSGEYWSALIVISYHHPVRVNI